jgi:hypothetical protein
LGVEDSAAHCSPGFKHQVDIHDAIAVALPRQGVVLAETPKIGKTGECLEETGRIGIVVRIAGFGPPRLARPFLQFRAETRDMDFAKVEERPPAAVCSTGRPAIRTPGNPGTVALIRDIGS